MKLIKNLLQWFMTFFIGLLLLVVLGLTLKFMWNVFKFGWNLL